MAEAGLTGARPKTGTGILAPSRTPPQVVAQLRTALADAVKTPEFHQSLTKLGASLNDVGADAFATLIDNETTRWAPIIRELGLKF